MALDSTIAPATCFLSLCLALVVAASLAAPAAVSASQGESSAAILAKIRDALGWRAAQAQGGGVLVEGVADTHGLQGPFTLLYDPAGRFIQKIHLRRDQVAAFDGVTAWAVDWSGTPRVLELADLEFEQTATWMRTGRWLAEDGPFHIELANDPGNATQVRLHVRLKHGLREMELLVDRVTWLPTRLTARHLGSDDVWEFGEYRSALGMKLAHRVVRRFGGSANTYEIRTVRPAPTTPADPFKPVLDRPRDTEFRASAPARFELKQGSGGHLFVRPKVNGADVGWFALDTGTGAGMTISPVVADRLGMPAFGKIVQGGAGKLGIGKLHEGKTFELGSMTIHNSIYVELPQVFCDMMKTLFGLEVVGTCGYDVFSRAVVEIDLAGFTACCHEPTGYTLPAGHWQPLLLNRKIPCVHVTYEGDRQGIFQFDTGAGRNVVFHAPEIARLKLLENRETTPIKVGGVGGAMDARIGQLEWFQVGDRRLEKPTAIFLAPHEGALDDPYVAGTFGAGILKNAKVVFDYPHRRIAFGG